MIINLFNEYQKLYSSYFEQGTHAILSRYYHVTIAIKNRTPDIQLRTVSVTKNVSVAKNVFV